ncbi:MAG TPA: hypothetical protein VHH73_17540 [Verrucomicrobiae bacterium]|nr:hypothetical protein [Verrucomicrobiae bacterium]
MNTAVPPKTARRRDVTREHIQKGYVIEAQRSRRAVFGETLWAEVPLPLGFVAPPAQILEDMLRRRFAPKARVPLSGGIHSFLTGCQLPGT